MSVLGTERDAIADALVGNWTRHTFVPDRVVPPAAIITPAEPYLEHRDTDPFGTLTVQFEVWLVAAQGTNAVVTDHLDTEIERQIDALTVAGFSVERVGEPFMYAVQGANYLTVVLTVTTGVTFTN